MSNNYLNHNYQDETLTNKETDSIHQLRKCPCDFNGALRKLYTYIDWENHAIQPLNLLNDVFEYFGFKPDELAYHVDYSLKYCCSINLITDDAWEIRSTKFSPFLSYNKKKQHFYCLKISKVSLAVDEYPDIYGYFERHVQVLVKSSIFSSYSYNLDNMERSFMTANLVEYINALPNIFQPNSSLKYSIIVKSKENSDSVKKIKKFPLIPELSVTNNLLVDYLINFLAIKKPDIHSISCSNKFPRIHFDIIKRNEYVQTSNFRDFKIENPISAQLTKRLSTVDVFECPIIQRLNASIINSFTLSKDEIHRFNFDMQENYLKKQPALASIYYQCNIITNLVSESSSITVRKRQLSCFQADIKQFPKVKKQKVCKNLEIIPIPNMSSISSIRTEKVRSYCSKSQELKITSSIHLDSFSSIENITKIESTTDMSDVINVNEFLSLTDLVNDAVKQSLTLIFLNQKIFLIIINLIISQKTSSLDNLSGLICRDHYFISNYCFINQSKVTGFINHPRFLTMSNEQILELITKENFEHFHEKFISTIINWSVKLITKMIFVKIILTFKRLSKQKIHNIRTNHKYSSKIFDRYIFEKFNVLSKSMSL